MHCSYSNCSVATSNNAHLPRFNSLLLDPRAEAQDAFAQSFRAWRRENNFCNPPWDAPAQLAQFLRLSGAAATVVAPYWPDTDWFRELRNMASSTLVLPPRRDLFLPGRLGSTVALEKPNWHVAIFRLPLRPPSGSR